tara:strand:+ start:35 stop:649 length:615 start_codon:yes stop_codon:yes gene_type:complete
MCDILDFFNDSYKNIPSGGAIVSNYTINIFKKHYNTEFGKNKDYDDKNPFEVNNKIHFKNEIKYLNILEKYDITPKVIEYNDINQELLLTGCGVQLAPTNLPENWREQILNIYEILKKENIYHNDIKFDNFTIKEGKIYLIDFGWSTYYMPGFPYFNLKYNFITKAKDFNDLLHKIYNNSSRLLLTNNLNLNSYINEELRKSIL